MEEEFSKGEQQGGSDGGDWGEEEEEEWARGWWEHEESTKVRCISCRGGIGEGYEG